MNKCESCYNMECVFVDNQIPFFDSENCQNYRGLTNADRIRGMTDEELAFWMTTNVTCCSCPVDLDACHNFEISGELSCEEILLNWLKAPVEVQK